MAVLAEEATECAPRLFALYGPYRKQMFEEDKAGFLAWGMELAALRKAILWAPDGTIWRSDSAVNLLATRQHTINAELTWLTPTTVDPPG
jgi:hypothetical protein